MTGNGLRRRRTGDHGPECSCDCWIQSEPVARVDDSAVGRRFELPRAVWRGRCILRSGTCDMALHGFLPSDSAQCGAERRLFFERLEDRRLLSLTHLYTFNDGSANDWIGSAHGALVQRRDRSGGATPARQPGRHQRPNQRGAVRAVGNRPAAGRRRQPRGLVHDRRRQRLDPRLRYWQPAQRQRRQLPVLQPRSSLATIRARAAPVGRRRTTGNGTATDDGAEHMAPS